MSWRNREGGLQSASRPGGLETVRTLGSPGGPGDGASAALDGRWVLVIDDDPAVRVLSARVLLEAGAVCQLAATHETALQILQREPRFDVALLDFTMPDGDGPQLVPRLLAIRPALMIVGSSGRDRSPEFEQAGVKRFLQKPWGIQDLSALLEG